MLTPTDRWHAAPKVAYEFLREEAVVLDLRSGKYYRLNSTAAEVWRILCEPKRLGDITDQLMMRYEVDLQTLLRDVEELLTGMEGQGLLIREPEES